MKTKDIINIYNEFQYLTKLNKQYVENRLRRDCISFISLLNEENKNYDNRKEFSEYIKRSIFSIFYNECKRSKNNFSTDKYDRHVFIFNNIKVRQDDFSFLFSKNEVQLFYKKLKVREYKRENTNNGP